MFNKKYEEYLSVFENYLLTEINKIDCEKILKDSIIYSLTTGGKRIRPVLMIAVNDILGGKLEDVLPFSLALEMIHTYSLIHDDLPAMDNDDFRRGKPSNHKKFGEGVAILAGDALLNLAMEIAIKESFKGINQLKATEFLFYSSGIGGMINGQAIDITYNESVLDKETLYKVIENKTAKLITAPVVIASLLNGGVHYDNLLDFGKSLGFIFQFTDDLLDDKEENINSLKVFTKDELKEVISLYSKKCINDLKDIKDNEFLIELTKYICKRKV
ncbi:MAG: polyprenyl synthetase family protein [Clostridiales bacterium]|nr:polyprenyl synthetase family protein [Clostridiales bacterium]